MRFGTTSGLTNAAVGLFTSFSASGSTNYAGDATKLGTIALVDAALAGGDFVAIA